MDLIQNVMEKIVWQFTNGKSLNAREFENYFERKVFRTIRKFSMLPSGKKIFLKKNGGINLAVLKGVLEKNFVVSFSPKPNFSDENLSEVAEGIFRNVLDGKFCGSKPDDKPARPLYFLSDGEVELYAKLKNLKGKKRKPDDKIRKLFDKFTKKNPDLEHNIVNSFGQL
jgi:hypothetical protein